MPYFSPLVFFLLGVSFFTFPAELEAGTRRALLVGIDDYQPEQSSTSAPSAEKHSAPQTVGSSANPPSARRAWQSLDGAVNDAEAMHALLRDRYQFPEKNIRILTNAEATHDNILAEIRRHLLDPAAPGDIQVFFYAGHGSQVVNSQSTEPDKKDETIVPADTNRGAWDIRDKELRRLFNDILDKGASLTVFFDSCHSGSIARGLVVPEKVRFMPSDQRDMGPIIKSEIPDARLAPEERGALVFSAAQDSEEAKEDRKEGVAHGAFSLALIEELQRASLTASAEQIFLRTRASMKNRGKSQEPVLAGPTSRRNQPLFGFSGETFPGRTVIAVLSNKDGKVELQGGLAVGLRKNSELKKADAGSVAQALRLRVEEVQSLSRATAHVIEGKADAIHAGDFFTIDGWVEGDEPLLRVWLPPATFRLAELTRIAQELAPLQTADHVQWIADPTEETPTATLSWNGSVWILTSPGKLDENLGKTIMAKAVLEKLNGRATNKEKLFVLLPPPSELVAQFKFTNQNSGVTIVSSPREAPYQLVGRVQGKNVEYAWIRPNVLRKEAEETSPLPVRTDWVATTDGQASAKVAGQLGGFALRLGRLQSWLQLQTPPDEGRFPYALALKNAKTGILMTEGTTSEGEEFDLVLHAPEEALKQGVEKRYVYVFSLDSFGDSHLLFPPQGQGNVENRIPYEPTTPSPTEISLRTRIRIAPPFGIDTYMLLSSREALPDPDVLENEGVRTRGKEPQTPLARLLYDIGQGNRGSSTVTPVSWSIAPLSLKSVPTK